MKLFRRCFYCREYSLEPNSGDLINKVYNFDDILNKTKKGEKYKLPEADLNTAFSKYVIDKITQKCSCCSHPLAATYKPDDALKYAYQAYDDFYEFMGGVNLPKEIKIKMVEGNMNTRGKYEYDENLKMFVVEFHTAELLHFNQFKATLFHEFTHLMDDYDPLTGKQNHKKRNISKILH